MQGKILKVKSGLVRAMYQLAGQFSSVGSEHGPSAATLKKKIVKPV